MKHYPAHVARCLAGHRAQMAYLADRLPDLPREYQAPRHVVEAAVAEFRRQRAAAIRSIRRTHNYNDLVIADRGRGAVITACVFYGEALQQWRARSESMRSMRQRDRAVAAVARRLGISEYDASKAVRRQADADWQRKQLNERIGKREAGAFLRLCELRKYVSALQEFRGSASTINSVLAARGAAQIDFLAPLRPMRSLAV